MSDQPSALVAVAKGADSYPDEPVPYTLRKPVTFFIAGHSEGENVTIEKVLVREPTGDDIIGLGKARTEEDKAARLIAAMCDQPYNFARKLTGWDFAQLGLIVARFFPEGGSPLES